MSTRIDYLAVGHVTRDLTPQGDSLGGSVTFGALTARALGLQPAIVSSAPDPNHPLLAPLDGIPTYIEPAEAFSTFENVYTPEGRIQYLRERAASLTRASLPEDMLPPRILHLAPLTDEVDPSLVTMFPDVWVGVTAQGWLRQWACRWSGWVQAMVTRGGCPAPHQRADPQPRRREWR